MDRGQTPVCHLPTGHGQSPGKLHPAKPILIAYLQVHEQKKCLLLSAAGFRAVCAWDYYDKELLISAAITVWEKA